MELDELESVDLNLLLHADGVESELWREGGRSQFGQLFESETFSGKTTTQNRIHSDDNEDKHRNYSRNSSRKPPSTVKEV